MSGKIVIHWNGLFFWHKNVGVSRMFSYPEIVGVTDWPASKSGPRKSATSQKGLSWPLPLFSTSRDSSKSKETSVIS